MSITEGRLRAAGFDGMTGASNVGRFILPGYARRGIWAEVTLPFRVVLRNNDGRELSGYVHTWGELVAAASAVGLDLLPAEKARMEDDPNG